MLTTEPAERGPTCQALGIHRSGLRIERGPWDERNPGSRSRF